MSGGTPLQSALGAGEPRGRRAAVLIVVLAVALVGVAIAKPWGSPVPTTPPTPGPSGSLVANAPHAASPTATETTAEPPPTPVGPSADAFTTPVPPPATAAWAAIRWQRLVPDDPLALVRSVLRWRGGFIATGWAVSGGVATTPVWTSRDGAHWEPLPLDTATTFWPGMLIVGVAEVRTGLVALTELGAGIDCGGLPSCQTFTPPAVSWMSTDGRAWSPGGSIGLDRPNSTAGTALLTGGPAGLVAATSGPTAKVATSSDGIRWNPLPDSTFPKGFAVADLRGTATGYVVGGQWMTSDTHSDAAVLWSVDGRNWPRTPSVPPTSPLPGSDVGSAVGSLVAGRDGFIATGRVVGAPGAALWWQSSDGRRWRPLPTYPPLGPTTCTGEGCEPNGVLVGDGERMIALRGGPEAGVWTSFDGLAWRRLPVTGELPSGLAQQVVLLPGGVLLSDGSSTWFGEALVP